MRTATTHGITVSGWVDHDPGDYWTPPSTVVDIDRIEDVEENSDALAFLADEVGFGASRVAEGMVRLGVPLPRSIEDWIISRFYDALVDALVDAY